MSRWPPVLVIAFGAFLVGTGLTVFVEHPAALTLGVLLLVAVLPLGLFGIATPAYLAERDDEELGLDASKYALAGRARGCPSAAPSDEDPHSA